MLFACILVGLCTFPLNWCVVEGGSAQCGVPIDPMQSYDSPPATPKPKGQRLSLRIIEGIPMTYTDTRWPWVMHVDKDTVTTHKICGGALVGARWALTAAHCVDPALDKELARLGPSKVISAVYNSADRFGQSTSSYARAIHRHPDYKTMPRNGSVFGAANDIALVEVG